MTYRLRLPETAGVDPVRLKSAAGERLRAVSIKSPIVQTRSAICE
jgi:hypothetical protein